MFARVNDINRMFGALDLFHHTPGGFSQGGTLENRSGEHVLPLTNLYDKGDSFEVRVEVPGLNKDDLSINLQGNALRITGKRVCGPLEGFTPHRQERKNLTFSRQYRLLADINPNGVEATLVDGLLVLNLEKVDAAQVKEIMIN